MGVCVCFFLTHSHACAIAKKKIIIIITINKKKRVQAHTASAIINFAEHCPKNIMMQYLPEFLKRLFSLLSHEMKTVREQCVIAVAAIADSCAEAFVPVKKKNNEIEEFLTD